MCTRRFVVTRTMLGNREQGWALWNGKEVVEMTSKEIITAIGKGEEILGLTVSSAGTLEPDKGFFTRNIMEHRQVGNYKPMLEEDSNITNLYYIVMGKNEAGLYDVISTKFERAAFSEEKVKMMLEIGVISAGAKLADGKVVLPILEDKTETTEAKQKESALKAKVEKPTVKEPAPAGKAPAAKK